MPRIRMIVLLALSFLALLPQITAHAIENTTAPKYSIELRPSPRILGGDSANDAQFPYQVSLRIRSAHTCGGSIISRNYVLTAAHCVTIGRRTVPAWALTVRAGSTRYDQGGIIANIAEVKKHPGYNFPSNDIALLRLSRPLSFTAGIRDIPLATRNVPANALVVASGWGSLSAGGATPRQLQYASLTALSDAQCGRVLGRQPESVLCLLHPAAQGVCQGDSGGPAVYNGTLVGATSFTTGQCGTRLPDGFAKIAYLHDWIVQNSDL